VHGLTRHITIKNADTLPTLRGNFPNAILNELRQEGCRRVGTVGNTLTPIIAQALLERYQTNLVDATSLVDSVRVIKSAWEIECATQSANRHDRVAEMVGGLLKLGVTEFEVRNELTRAAWNLGFSESNINIGFHFTHPSFPPVFFQTKALEPDDRVIGLIQGNADGGCAMEVGRMWTLGEPPAELERAYRDALAVQNFMAAGMIPGASSALLFKQANAMLVGMGYDPERRMFGHGEWLDFIEPPAIMPEETMPFSENMILAIHPTARNERVSAFSCDNYLVTPQGGVRINQTPQQILTV
jgi:Xaa-Pro aminopeptidase